MARLYMLIAAIFIMIGPQCFLLVYVLLALSGDLMQKKHPPRKPRITDVLRNPINVKKLPGLLGVYR
jgi:hypothetical protein